MTENLGAGNGRVGRLVRFIRTLPGMPDASWLATLQVRDGDDWSDIMVFDPIAEANGPDISETLQAMADEAGAAVKARLLVELADLGREVSHAMRATPSPDSEPLPPGSEFDGSQVGQVQQAQRHVEALVRISIQERAALLKGMATMLESQNALLEKAFDRLMAAQDTADQSREELHQFREALLQVDEESGDEGEVKIPPQIEAILGVLAGAAMKRLQAPAAPKPPAPEEPAEGDQ